MGSEFAATVCELLNWTTPADRAKTQQCLSLLEQLETENIIQLPQKAGNKGSEAALNAIEMANLKKQLNF